MYSKLVGGLPTALMVVPFQYRFSPAATIAHVVSAEGTPARLEVSLRVKVV